MLPFLVSDYNRSLVALLIKQCFGASFPDINRKRQVEYLFNYLDKLISTPDQATVVCETTYIDRDYLEDYSRYYVRCFERYPSHCARLHFFDAAFTHEDLTELLKDNSYSDLSTQALQKHYLGFVVIKPLPLTFIGRTCLKLYDKPSINCISREYEANLFGIQLTVNSVAFQEQDKVVSACATTALWTLYHAMNHLPAIKLPSPSEITLHALSAISSSINGFPNEGLSHAELLNALERSNIKCHELKITSKKSESLSLLTENIITYISSKLPILLGTRVYREAADTGKYELLGNHAVTLLGYKLLDSTKKKAKIEKLFIHDDRIGPYAAIKYCDNAIKIKDQTSPEFYFTLEVKNNGHQNRNHRKEIIIIDSAIIGTYHKIRIPYSLIGYTCDSFKHEILRKANNDTNEEIPDDEITYSTELFNSSILKKEYFNTLKNNHRINILLNHWPKFVWKTTFFINFDDGKKPIFDLIFDTTDIPQGKALIDVVVHDESAYNIIESALMDSFDSYIKQHTESDGIPESFFIPSLTKIKERMEIFDFYQELDRRFGDLRPPKYIKKGEETITGVSRKRDTFEIISSNDIITYPELENSKPDLEKIFHNNQKMIWVITKHGTLIIGADDEEKGHPTLTGAKPARIAGEITKNSNTMSSSYTINGKSGRYSKHYTQSNIDNYLKFALAKFQELFPGVNIEIEKPEPPHAG